MKQQDLRKLSRGELLEILIQQGEELEALRSQIEEHEQQMHNRSLAVSEAGSIAEAALKVSGIFEAAEAASAQYTASIRDLAQRQEAYTQEAAQLLEQTRAECAEMKAKTRAECDKMIQRAKKESLSYWVKVSRKLDSSQ